MSFLLRVTFRAENELQSILNYLKSRSNSGARSWYRKLEKTFERIAETPFSFGRALESEGHDEEIRQATFKALHGLPYRILFIVREQTIFVIHIRGFGQDDIPPTDLRLPSR